MSSPLDPAQLFLAGAVLLLALLCAPNRLFQRPKANEPPLEAGFLPWLGVGLQMRDMDAFMKRSFAKHGDTFTAYAAGKRLVFTKDIVTMKHVAQNPDFAAKPNHVSRPPYSLAACSSATIQQSFYTKFLQVRPSRPDEDALFSTIGQTLTGSNLVDMKAEFTKLWIEALDKFEGGEVEFFSWARKIIFTCTT